MCAKNTTSEIGTNSQLASLVRSRRPSRSHRPKARKASATESAKFTKPNRNGIAVDEWQREEGGRRHSPVHLLRDPQETDGRQWRNRGDDQLHRRLEPDNRRQHPHEKVDAKIADQCPVVIVILRAARASARGRARPGSGPYARTDPPRAGSAGRAKAAWSRTQPARCTAATSHHGRASSTTSIAAPGAPIVTRPLSLPRGSLTGCGQLSMRRGASLQGVNEVPASTRSNQRRRWTKPQQRQDSAGAGPHRLQASTHEVSVGHLEFRQRTRLPGLCSVISSRGVIR